MSKSIGLIGAPTSAGAFAPGRRMRRPRLRDAGLVARLRAAGVDVVDLGDTPRFRWRPDPHDRFAMNAGAVRAAALAVAERVSAALERDLLPLVIGGDCTVELGTVLGWQRHRRRDHARVLRPASRPEHARHGPGRRASTGWAWPTCSGNRARVRELDRGLGRPCAPEDVLVLGYSRRARHAWPSATTIAAARHPRRRAGGESRPIPPAPPRRRLAWTRERGGPFLVHFDADSIDFADLPLAENTDRNVGLSFDDVADALDALLRGEVGAVTVTEINPHHGEPDGVDAATLPRSVRAGARPLGLGASATPVRRCAVLYRSAQPRACLATPHTARCPPLRPRARRPGLRARRRPHVHSPSTHGVTRVRSVNRRREHGPVAVPGPAVICVLTRSVDQGRSVGLVSVLRVETARSRTRSGGRRPHRVDRRLGDRVHDRQIRRGGIPDLSRGAEARRTLLAVVSDGAYVLLAGAVAGRLRTSRRARGGLAKLSGGVYIGLGISAALSGTRAAKG